MQKNRTEDDEVEANAEARSILIERIKAWRIQFIVLGGFTHLLYTLANLDLNEIACLLELVCVKTLLEILYRFQSIASAAKLTNGKSLLESQDPELLKQIVLKIVKYIDLICKFSIQEELERGQSFEVIEKRIENAKLRKNRYKLMI